MFKIINKKQFVQVNHHSREEFTISVGNWNSCGQHP